MSVTSSDSPGYIADRARRWEASLEVTMISLTLALRKWATWSGLLTSTTVLTWGAIDSMARTVRIEDMSA